MNANDLLRERAELLARVEEINKTLELLQKPASAVRIYTSRNLRNTWPFTVNTGGEGIMVWGNPEMTIPANRQDHSGWVSAEDAARLRLEYDGVGLEM